MLKKKPIIFLLFILLSLAFIFLNSKGFLDYPKSAVNYLISPISKPIWSGAGKLSGFFSFVFNIKDVYIENAVLKEQNKKLLAENAYLSGFIAEKDILEKAKNIQAQENFNWQIGRVIGMDAQNWSGYIIVDVGSGDGVSVGMPVIDENKMLIGKIAETGKDFSKVLTIFNSSMKVAAKTQNSGAFGVVVGDYTRKLTMDFIAKDKVLAQGEAVLTSAKDGIFPEGLIVGTVEDFQVKPENLFQSVSVKSEFDIYGTSRVLILTKF